MSRSKGCLRLRERASRHPGFLLTQDFCRRGESLPGMNGPNARSISGMTRFLSRFRVCAISALVRSSRYGMPRSRNKRGDLLASQAKHRAQNFEPVRVGRRLHPTQPGCAAAAKKIEQAGFDLVVAMVRQKNSPAAMVLRARLEKCIAQGARGRLEGEFFPRGKRADIRFAQLERIAQFSRGCADKRGNRRLRRPRGVDDSDDTRSVSCSREDAGRIARPWNRALPKRR